MSDWRKIALLVAGLPIDSLTVHAREGLPAGALWSRAEILTAKVIDSLAVLSWQMSGNKHASKPTPFYTMPTSGGTSQGGYTMEELDELLTRPRREKDGD